ncbi:MAG: metallophosphoesterase [Acidobacteriota bacterium]
MATSNAVESSQKGRIVAVGDIHGDRDAFAGILQEAGLIDADFQWVGGSATLVQTGDFMDRGPQVREVMDLLMDLERQAPKHGGRVEILLGNHEGLNLLGVVRDNSAADAAAFVDDDSGRRRDRAFKDYMEMAKRRARQLHRPAPELTPELQEQWLSEHPLGFVERMRALGPEGSYGRWLRHRPAVLQLGDTIFLHGGISPALAAEQIKKINERLKKEMEAFDRYKRQMVQQHFILPFSTFDEMTEAVQTALPILQSEAALTGSADPRQKRLVGNLESVLKINDWYLLSADGPLWFRGLAMWPEEQSKPLVEEILEKKGARHIVIAHTRRADGRIYTRFGGKVFIIDTSMSRVYEGGRPAALEIQGGRFTAIYAGERIMLLDPSDSSADQSDPFTTRTWVL